MAIRDIHEQAGRRGFVTTEDVRTSDVGRQVFYRHAHRIGWSARHRGLWVPTGVSLDARARIDAAVVSVGNDVLVTGRSALYLFGVLDDPGDAVELLLPAGRHIARRQDVRLVRSRMFDTVRFQHKEGVRVAAPARALADAARQCTINELCHAIATAARLRLCTLAALGAEIQRRKRFPGRTNLRVAVGLLSGELTHSADERVGRRLLRSAGLVPHRQPLAIEHNGRVIAEIDIPFERSQYGVEIDGPHHLLPNVAAADRSRDRQLRSIGWVIDRFYWFELEDRPQWFVAEVKRRLGEVESDT